MSVNYYIYGAAGYGVATAFYLRRKNMEISGFIDRDAEVIGNRLGIKVITLDEYLAKNPENSMIMIAICNGVDDVIKTLLDIGLKQDVDFILSPLNILKNQKFESREAFLQAAERDSIFCLHDEEAARKAAEGWDGEYLKPKGLRFIDGAVPVTICTNAEYAPYAAVFLQSLLDYTSNERKYHFILFETGLKNSDKQFFYEQTKRFANCEIDIVNVTVVLEKLPIKQSEYTYVSKETYIRLFLPYWLERYKKVIYLDCDMLAKADISELLDVELENHMLAAVSRRIHFYENLSPGMFPCHSAVFTLLNNMENYFTSATLVFNTEEYTKRISYDDFMRSAIYFENRYFLGSPDQDLLNLFVRDNYLDLGYDWNYVWTREKSVEEGYNEQREHIKILHYEGREKPWDNTINMENNERSIEYREYAKRVPLYQTRNNKGAYGEK